MDVSTIAERAASYRPLRAVLTLIAAPLYLAGFLAAVIWIVATWCYAAAATGWGDARRRVSDGEA